MADAVQAVDDYSVLQGAVHKQKDEPSAHNVAILVLEIFKDERMNMVNMLCMQR